MRRSRTGPVGEAGEPREPLARPSRIPLRGSADADPPPLSSPRRPGASPPRRASRGASPSRSTAPRTATLTYTDDARASYNEAIKSFKARDWEDAQGALHRHQEALRRTPATRGLSELRLADINFEQEKFSGGRSRSTASTSRTTRTTPNDRVRASYRVSEGALQGHRRHGLPPAGRRSVIRRRRFEAYKEIRSFLRHYPRSRPTEKDASATCYEVVVGRLVRHELYVARFYLHAETRSTAAVAPRRLLAEDVPGVEPRARGAGPQGRDADQDEEARRRARGLRGGHPKDWAAPSP